MNNDHIIPGVGIGRESLSKPLTVYCWQCTPGARTILASNVTPAEANRIAHEHTDTHTPTEKENTK